MPPKDLTTLVLLKPHRHNGAVLPPGDLLTVPTPVANWLIAMGTGRRNGVQLPKIAASAKPVRRARGCCGQW